MIELDGLSKDEVDASREMHGFNGLTEHSSVTFLDKLFENAKDPMILILIVALVVVIFLSLMGYTEWYEGVGIAVAVALATLVSTFSEFKNEQTFQKLQEEASKIFLNVFRSGELRLIPIDQIVVGDLVFLQPGDKVPADGSVFYGSMKINQAMLNGEAEPVTKSKGAANLSDLDDKSGMYRGTIVEDGEGVLLIQVVGDHTHFGKLAQALKTEDRTGPLRVKLSILADQISKFGYIGAPLIALAFMFKILAIDHGMDLSGYFAQDWHIYFNDIMTALILAVIIVVVVVPEGLPMMIAIVLAQNMQKLLKSKVLVRQLLGIETAGSLNLLFSDKTGTITKGKLEAVGFIGVDESVSNNIQEYKSIDDIPTAISDSLQMAIRENTSAIINRKAKNENERILGGNSTERALLKFVKADQAVFKSPVVETRVQILFSSARKYSASEVVLSSGESLTLVKGAAERILENCSFYTDLNGERRVLSEKLVANLTKQLDKKAFEGVRLIGVAITSKPASEDNIPEEMSLLGFSLIRDELRPDAKAAITELQSAGIQIVMCTGDRHGTAVAIAKESGLIEIEDYVAITSMELEKMSDEELKAIIPKLRVISRCLPNDKTRLVDVSQSLGLVVGMTGDGVNDSPALSKSDVGFALGSGTEVAKEASDIVVLDDNIQSIANAVHYGRTIYRSVQKFITFQLSVNVSAIFLAFVGPFFGFKLPLTMIQLLWINLIMDTLAALAFSGEPPLGKHMQEQPKSRDESLISAEMWSSILFNGLYIGLLCLVFLTMPFFKSIFQRIGNSELSQIVFLTAFFSLFVLLNNFNKFNVRVEELNLLDHILANKGFLKVVVTIFIVQFILTELGGEMFRTTSMNSYEWLWVLGLAFSIIPVDLARKALFTNRK
jgi:calcium-translocating P-type ATPase|tara:strand:- start:14604 stop:17282 length:2679 start_codon:yes stop_codon:yes gene_type:complete